MPSSGLLVHPGGDLRNAVEMHDQDCKEKIISACQCTLPCHHKYNTMYIAMNSSVEVS